ncbi:hypothetical protein ABZ554_46440, partial [Streptomyces sp. NPDC020125]
AADARAAGGVTVRIPDAGALGRRGTRALPTDSDRAGWITVRVDEEDADDIGLSQLPAAFRASTRTIPLDTEPAPPDHAYAFEEPPADTREHFPGTGGGEPGADPAYATGELTATPENEAAAPGSAATGPAARWADGAAGAADAAAVVEYGQPHVGPANEARPGVSAKGAHAPASDGLPGIGPGGEAGPAEPMGGAASVGDRPAGDDLARGDGVSASRAVGEPCQVGQVTGGVEEAEGSPAATGDGLSGIGPVGEAGTARHMVGAAASVDDWLPDAGLVGGAEETRSDGQGADRAEDAEAGPERAHRRRPLAAESRAAGRVTVRIDEAEDALLGDGGPCPDGPRDGARAVAADSRPPGEVSARVGDGDDGRAESEAATGTANVTHAEPDPGTYDTDTDTDGDTDPTDESDCWAPEPSGAPGRDRGDRSRPAPRPLGDGPLTGEELDRNAEALRELLEESVASAERQLFELRTAAAEDSRILGALGDGGLLPPSPDVLAAVEYLGEHGIPALPGWRYLAQAVDPVDHAAVLAARPELVDGVVITDPDTHARARAVLAQASLLPRSAVAVGTSAALLAPTPAPGTEDSGVFLVPPNPAMHDERAADDERRGLRARATERDEEIRALAARLAGDRALSARLASWRTGCPPGRLAELAAAAETSRETADTAQRELVEARTARAEADEAATEAARDRDERQEAAQRARRVADALAGLAYRLRERATWQTRLRELAATTEVGGGRGEHHEGG